MAELKIVITVDSKGAISGIQGVGGAADKAGKQVAGAKAALGEIERQGNRALQSLSQSMGPLGSVLSSIGPGGLAAAAGIGVTVGAAYKLADVLGSVTAQALSYADGVQKMADKTAMSTTFVQQLRYACGQTGTDFETAAAAANKLEVAIGQGSKAFGDYGISLETLKAMSPNQQLASVLMVIRDMKDPTEQAAAANAMLGRSWQEVAPLMRAGFAENIALAGEYGLVMRGETVAALDRVGDAAATTSASWAGFKNEIGAVLAQTPGLTDALLGIARAVGAITLKLQDQSGPLRKTVDTMTDWIAGLSGLKGLSGTLKFLDQSGALGTSSAELAAIANNKALAARNALKGSDDVGVRGGLYKEITAELETHRRVGTENRRIEADLAELAKKRGGLYKEITRDISAAYMKDVEARANVIRASEEAEAQQQQVYEGVLASALAANGLAKETDAIRYRTLDWADAVVSTVDALGLADTSLGRMLDVAGEVAERFQRIKDAGGEIGAADYLGAAGSLLGQVGGGKGKIAGYGNYISGNAKATQQILSGDIVGGIATGVGSAAGFAKSLFGGKSRTEKAGEDIRRLYGRGVSDETTTAVKDLSETLGVGRTEASLLAMTRIADETGQRVSSMTGNIRREMEAIKLGAIPTKEGLAALGDQFAAIAAEQDSVDRTNALRKMLKDAKDLGLELPGISEFLKGSLAAEAQGVSGLVSGGVKITDAASAKDQAVLFSTTFWDTVEQEGFAAATKAMAPAFDALSSGFGAAGVDTAVLGPMQRMFDLAKEGSPFAGAIQGSEALGQILQSQLETNRLTADSWGAIQRQAQAAHDQMIAGGATEEEALFAQRGLLQQIQQAAEASGMSVDAGMQSLIDKAQAAGPFVVGPEERLADVMEMRVAPALEGMARMMGVDIPEAADKTAASLAGMGAKVAESCVTDPVKALATATGEELPGKVDVAASKFDELNGRLSGAITTTPVDTLADMIGRVLPDQVDVSIDKFAELRDAISQTADAGAFISSASGTVPWEAVPMRRGGIVYPRRAAAGIVVPPLPGTGTLVQMGEGGSAEVAAPVTALFGALGNQIAIQVARAVGDGREGQAVLMLNEQVLGEAIYRMSQRGTVRIATTAVIR